MPAPSTGPQFATNTNFTVDGDDWGGSSVKIDPGTSRRNEGFEPDTLPAEWLNWVLNNHGEWLKWHDDELFGSLANRKIRISPFLCNFDGSEWQIGYDLVLGVSLASTVDRARLVLNLDDIFVSGTTINSVTALVNPGALRPVGNRVKVNYARVTMDFTGPGGSGFVMGTEVESANTTVATPVPITVGIAISKTSFSTLEFILLAGDDGGVHVGDVLHGIEIDYTGVRVR